MVIGNLLTFAAEFVVLAFAAIAVFDFTSGLCSLWLASSFVNTVNKCPKSELLTLAPTPQQEPVQQLETPEPPVVDDPWLMTADIATPTCCCTTATIATPKPLLLLPPAPEFVKQPELELDPPTPPGGYLQERVAGGILPPAISRAERGGLRLTALKLYKLHGYSVVKVSDLLFEIPTTIKRYKLHKKDVVRLIDLEQFLAAL